MDILVTLLSSAVAVVFIVFGVAVQSGAGVTMVTKLDRMFEQRFASQAIILDSDTNTKNS